MKGKHYTFLNSMVFNPIVLFFIVATIILFYLLLPWYTKLFKLPIWGIEIPVTMHFYGLVFYLIWYFLCIFFQFLNWQIHELTMIKIECANQVLKVFPQIYKNFQSSHIKNKHITNNDSVKTAIPGPIIPQNVSFFKNLYKYCVQNTK